MRTSILTIILVAAVSATPLLAEGDMKCGCMKEPDTKAEMQKKMEAKMKAEETELNALLGQMNTSTGDKKVEAMAALLNKLLQEHKKMAAMCEKMEEGKKPDGEPPKAAEHQH